MAPYQAPSALHHVHNNCQRSGWPQPKLDFYVDQDDKDLLHGNLLLGNQLTKRKNSGRGKDVRQGATPDLWRKLAPSSSLNVPAAAI